MTQSFTNYQSLSKIVCYQPVVDQVVDDDDVDSIGEEKKNEQNNNTLDIYTYHFIEWMID